MSTAMNGTVAEMTTAIKIGTVVNIAKFKRKQRKEKLDLRRRLAQVNSLVLSTLKGNPQRLAKFRRKLRKERLDFKRKFRITNSSSFIDMIGESSLHLERESTNMNNLSVFENEGSGNPKTLSRKRRQQRMEKLKSKRLHVRFCPQKYFVRRGLRRTGQQVTHSRIADPSVLEETSINGVMNSTAIDIQLSNVQIFRIAENKEYFDIGDMNIQCSKWKNHIALHD
ncbi:hypothetical protein TSUD_63670 [Trifolium subterraneum]|uniref:Uncharacterized protein n=1 Tax=Trifolium subterraneum TaxID=3900 RepID=A0A2Z6MHX5_TRISU|nr:hypothetical protein TSUD_63670 [Trifolium subterraneum]